MEQNKRGQAALEFLLTYSWAILVVIVIIGALAYFGVLNPENFIPERCTFAAGLNCDDYVYSGNQFEIAVTNGFGRSINVTNFTITSPSGFTSTAGCNLSTSTVIPNGGTEVFVLSGTGCEANEGISKLRGQIEVQYINVGTAISTPRVVTGEIFVSVLP
jgi:uncharacterized protein (UPF0333 family)